MTTISHLTAASFAGMAGDCRQPRGISVKLLFAAGLPILFTAGRVPLETPIMLTLLGLILRRAIANRLQAAYAQQAVSP
jgi:hypothetical protein